jgi:hypothetical protein
MFFIIGCILLPHNYTVYYIILLYYTITTLYTIPLLHYIVVYYNYIIYYTITTLLLVYHYDYKIYWLHSILIIMHMVERLPHKEVGKQMMRCVKPIAIVWLLYYLPAV